MDKSKTAHSIPFVNLPKQCCEEGITEVSIKVLLDNFTSYTSAMTQTSFRENEIVYFDYDHDAEQYCFARHFVTSEGCKGALKIFVSEKHLEMAKLLANNEKMASDSPPKKKKAKKSDGIL